MQKSTTTTADTPTWWGDVQQQRDDLAPAVDDWLDEEIDFIPQRRLPAPQRQRPQTEPKAERPQRSVRGSRTAAERRVLDALGDIGGVVEDFGVREQKRSGSFDLRIDADGQATIVDADEISLPSDITAGEIILSGPADERERRTVQITGQPERVASSAQRLRRRTLLDVIGPHPDRIVFWVVALGLLLIVLSTLST